MSPSESWSRDMFDHFLRSFKEELFEIRLPVHRMSIEPLLRSVCRTILSLSYPFSDKRPISINLKSKVSYYLRNLPSTISARPMHEKSSNNHTPVENFCIAETNNLLNIIDIVVNIFSFKRKDLTETLSCCQNGIYTPLATEIILMVNQNIIPTTWMRYSQPTNTDLDVWISGITTKVISLNQWSERGLPKSFSVKDIFSIRALIRTSQMIFAYGQNIPLEQTEILLMFGPEKNSLSNISIEGINLIGCGNIRSTANFIFSSRNILQKELIKDTEQVIELSGIGPIENENKANTFQIASNDGPPQDSTRINEIFKFNLRGQLLDQMNSSIFPVALVEDGIVSLRNYNSNIITSKLEISHHICIYLSSSVDTENERYFISTNVIPKLKLKMHEENINIQFIDIRSDPQFSESEFNDILCASTYQIERSHIFIGVYGAKLGGLFDVLNFSSDNAVLSNIMKNKNVLPQIELEFSQDEKKRRFIFDDRQSLFYLRGI
jgi:hypothetical protein